ncbi:MAG: hypothetical protein ACR2NU_09695 [Aeoliella sp.]
MKRPMFAKLLLATLVSCASTLGTGCRSCHSPHDYSSPVADCGCNSCGGRAGSAFSGAVAAPQEYVEPVPQDDQTYGETVIDQGPVMMDSIAE